MTKGARAALVFSVALGLRLLLLFGTEHGPVSHDQSWYYYGGLSVAEHARPLSFVLSCDSWRRWQGLWTIAPLYYLFVASVFRTFGESLLALQLVQCLLGALSAVLVFAMGETLAVGFGLASGLAYSLYWPAADLNSLVYTENLHTPLLLLAFALLLGPGARRSFLGGVALGVSALARSVSSAFIPLASLAKLVQGGRPGRAAAVLVLSGSLLPIVPWLVRNVVLGEPPTIETVGVLNLLLDNAYEPRPVYREAGFFYGKRPERASRQALAFVVRNIRSSPGAFASKIRSNLSHLARLDGLHEALYRGSSDPAWEQWGFVVGSDVVWLAACALFLLYAVAGPRDEARLLLVLWVVYYVFMIVVAFHVEVRYRSALVPVLLVGAAPGLEILTRRTRAGTALLGLGLAGGVVLLGVATYGGGVLGRARAEWRMRGLARAVSALDLEAARGEATAAGKVDPTPARPLLVLGHLLAQSGRNQDALAAYEGAALVQPDSVIAQTAVAFLLQETGADSKTLGRALRLANAATDDAPSLGLDAAWRELPPPRSDFVALGHGDYAAARGFFGATASGRFTMARSELRMRPLEGPGTYDATLAMSSPEPSPLESPTVVAVDLLSSKRFSCPLGRTPTSCTFRVTASREGVVHLELLSTTWSRPGEPPGEGVLVERLTLAPRAE